MTLNRKIVLLLASLFITPLLMGFSNPHKLNDSKMSAFDSSDVYSADLPTAPLSTVMVYVPFAENEEIFEIEEYFDEDYVRVEFDTDHQYENSANFNIVPKRSKFASFNRQAAKVVQKHYAHHPEMIVTQVYHVETRLDKHPAYFNVYTVVPTGDLSEELYEKIREEYHEIYEDPDEREHLLEEIEDEMRAMSENKIIITQYVVNYKYHYADIKFIAHTNAKYDPIWSQKSAIERTYMPAYEYFRSFHFSYDVDEEKEDEEEVILDEVNSKARI